MKGIFAYLWVMWSNFHTHSYYCDGKGAMQDYLNAALRSGVGYLGFSSHAPIPFPCKWCLKGDALPAYLAEIESLKPQYAGIQIYTGLEIDYIPEIITPADFAPQLDYTIGSIHFVERFGETHWEIDNTAEAFREGLARIFGNDIRTAVSRYYELTREMIAKAAPNIVGHLDKIKINSRSAGLDESALWYRDEVERTLRAIADSDAIVEVNTRGIYKKKSPDIYPSPWILERILQLRIPITLNSDAHHPDDLTREFESSLSLLKDIGFRQLLNLDEGSWREMPIDQYGDNR